VLVLVLVAQVHAVLAMLVVGGLLPILMPAPTTPASRVY